MCAPCLPPILSEGRESHLGTSQANVPFPTIFLPKSALCAACERLRIAGLAKRRFLEIAVVGIALAVVASGDTEFPGRPHGKPWRGLRPRLTASRRRARGLHGRLDPARRARLRLAVKRLRRRFGVLAGGESRSAGRSDEGGWAEGDGCARPVPVRPRRLPARETDGAVQFPRPRPPRAAVGPGRTPARIAGMPPPCPGRTACRDRPE